MTKASRILLILHLYWTDNVYCRRKEEKAPLFKQEKLQKIKKNCEKLLTNLLFLLPASFPLLLLPEKKDTHSSSEILFHFRWTLKEALR